MVQKLKRNWLVSSQLTWGIWRLLTQALKNIENLHFNGLLLTKAYNVWAKKRIEELCLMVLNIDAKFERKMTLCFQKWHEEFSKFSPEHMLESLKIWTFMGSIHPKLKMYGLKIYRGVLCHDNEEWTKIWRGIDLSVQNWHGEYWQILTRVYTRKSQKFAL